MIIYLFILFIYHQKLRPIYWPTAQQTTGNLPYRNTYTNKMEKKEQKLQKLQCGTAHLQGVLHTNSSHTLIVWFTVASTSSFCDARTRVLNPHTAFLRKASKDDRLFSSSILLALHHGGRP